MGDVRRPIRRHLVDREPENLSDVSRVLCIRAGDCKRAKPRTVSWRDGWTQQHALVTCPKCLEWMHA